METIRLVHATDFHFAETPARLPPLLANGSSFFVRLKSEGTKVTLAEAESHNPGIASSFAKWMWERRAQVDVFLVTGDLATTGNASDLKRAQQFFTEKTSEDLKWLSSNKSDTTLSPSVRPERVVMIPGNHDRFHSLTHLPPYGPGNRAFEDHFGLFWPSTARVNRKIFGRNSEVERLIVIAADFTLREPTLRQINTFGYLGEGDVDDITLTQLKSATRQTKKSYPSAVIFWAVHFCPRTGVVPTLSLKLADTLISAAIEFGIHHIFCGHVHYDLIDQQNSVWIHTTGPTTTMSPDIARCFADYEIGIEGSEMKTMKRRRMAYSDQTPTIGHFVGDNWKYIVDESE